MMWLVANSYLAWSCSSAKAVERRSNVWSNPSSSGHPRGKPCLPSPAARVER